jgi:integral membrane protein
MTAPSPNPPVTFLRRIALIEAVSYFILVAIAAPLKRFPETEALRDLGALAVRYVGMAHGVLFIVFCWALLGVLRKSKWPVSRCALVFAISFIPILPFFFDRRMKEWESEAAR